MSTKNNNGLPEKVAVLYSDDDRKYFTTNEQHLTVAGAYEDALRFEPYLRKLKIKSTYIKADSKMAANLANANPDLAINVVTTVKGLDYLGAGIPGVLELLDIPYTGTNLMGFALGSNKYVIYSLLYSHGIPIPPFQLFDSPNTKLDSKLKYPLILKLNEEHSNVEITKESVVENDSQLRKRLKYLFGVYNQEVLVSEFIEGREFASFVLHDSDKDVYTFERIINNPESDKRFQFMDYKLVWQTKEGEFRKRLKYKTYSDKNLDGYIKKAFDICRMDQYGKFDIRMDKKGNYYIIDANANCYFAPPNTTNDSEITFALEMHGVRFETFLKTILIKTLTDKRI